MYSITIGNKNTWNDWHLTPKNRPYVVPPTPKTNFIDVPGANGSLDASTALSGSMKFNNRSGNWDFIVENDFKPWHELYSEIMNTIHGKALKVVLSTDPLFYYEGRISVSNWDTGRNWSTISLSYTFAPYKKLVNGTMRNWIWDTFDLESGYIHTYENIPISGTTPVEVVGAPVEAYPLIESSASGITVSLDDATAILSQGLNRVTAFKIQNGTNNLIFTGTGTVSIDFEGESL